VSYYNALEDRARPGWAAPVAGPYPTMAAARRARALDELTARVAGIIGPRDVLRTGRNGAALTPPLPPAQLAELPPEDAPKLPGCAIRGSHSRARHMTYCRPAIDAAWNAMQKAPELPHHHPYAPVPITDPDTCPYCPAR